MSKPRLCEILGVEVNERFKIGSHPSIYHVSEGGYFDIDRDDDLLDTDTLCEIINCPGLIIHKPKWTQQDIEDAKAIKRLFPGIETVHRSDNGRLYIHDTCQYTLNPDTFVNLDFGESVELDEIINEEET